jgi:hypothetical protein
MCVIIDLAGICGFRYEIMLWWCMGGKTGLGIWDIHMVLCVDGKERTGANCMDLRLGWKQEWVYADLTMDMGIAFGLGVTDISRAFGALLSESICTNVRYILSSSVGAQYLGSIPLLASHLPYTLSITKMPPSSHAYAH